MSAQAKLVEAFLPDGYDFDGTHLSPE
ncbi:MAG: hypothetical protein ACI9U2_000280 [Bradymonadia bacterium]